MERDYAKIVAALRAKAASPVVPDTEAKTLRDKADELERKHGPFTKTGAFAFTFFMPKETPADARAKYDEWLDSILGEDRWYDPDDYV